MIRILAAAPAAMAIERLRLLDMFLLYPPLLYRVSLPAPVKDKFRRLRLETPEKIFVRLPSTASIWQDLQLYQSTALTRLGGTGILRNEELHQRRADLNHNVVPPALWQRVKAANEQQSALLDFLAVSLTEVPIAGKDNLFRRAALPARGPVL